MKRFRTIFACVAVFLFLLSGCGITKSRIKSEREADAHHKLGIAYLNENNLQMAFMEFSKAVDSNLMIKCIIMHLDLSISDWINSMML